MNAFSQSSLVTEIALDRLANLQSRPKLDHLEYDEWLQELFPYIFYSPFAEHHDDFWRHVSSIEPGEKPPAYFMILARGGGKDANVQGAIARLGALKKRRFCLYVCATQDLANKVVQTLSKMLEGSKISNAYPLFTQREMTKYGQARGWRVDLLRCNNGFSVAGLGLDSSVRGIRLDEVRPDLIVFSDADSRKDSEETIAKKKETITNDILPAGSSDTAVLWIQNMMHSTSITRQIVEDKVDFLRNRVVNGPHKAVDNLVCELGNDNKYHILSGVPTWEGQNLQVCENQINEWGYTTFMIESQHEVDLVEGGMYEHITFKRCNPDEVPEAISTIVFVDPAITSDNDKMGIQADSLCVDDLVYRRFSWEENSTPATAIMVAIGIAVELGADAVGFETDQGGDLWEDSYNRIWEEMIAKSSALKFLQNLPEGTDVEAALKERYEDQYFLEELLEWDYAHVSFEKVQPDFISARAGAVGSKKHRGQIQVREYEASRFVHVRNGMSHVILEAALQRFPIKKPFDLHDAAFWSQYYLIENAPAGN